MLEAVLRARTAQGAIAWAISLLSFPVITVPLYLVFGRIRFDGYLEQRDTVESRARKLIEAAGPSVAAFAAPEDPGGPLSTSLLRLARPCYGEAATRSSTSAMNRRPWERWRR